MKEAPNSIGNYLGPYSSFDHLVGTLESRRKRRKDSSDWFRPRDQTIGHPGETAFELISPVLIHRVQAHHQCVACNASVHRAP